MPDQAVLRVDMDGTGLRVDRAALARALADLPRAAPVVVMIHGYRFAPGARGGNCPHRHIFSMQPPAQDWTAISWPRHLGLSGGRALAIGFGWPARGGFHGACLRAGRAGRALAELAALVQSLDQGRAFDVVGHSLGARVALAALPHAAPGDLRRMILLAGAETRRPALRAMGSAAGRAVQVVNVTTRENDLFDFLFEWLGGAGLDTAIGQGLCNTPVNWLDVQLDQPATLAALARLGHDLPSAPARISHWSPYLRPGALGLYRAILDGSLPVEALQRALPERRDPRWSRLLAGWHWPLAGRTQRA
ncbi:hypothetical protein GCM10010873_38550 [Cypionkella aquatica]|uniref:Alpha/beta hydrolase n=1 Tax=Cypionkella aquatica TaxID=1756042 RepID=A0AA37X698_9RHOB|nr:alpha/beta fold hydrolase [Cypionkella aquatica]GLS88881.1 hypothetical protein GCM10010873_38550 [Cypionkella aquatica]